MRMREITAEMRVRDALPLLSAAEQISLQYWAAEFGIPLREFHLGHIRTYEMQRLQGESRYVVNAEVSVLLRLLESVGLGEDIRRRYQPLRDPEELSPEERAALPERTLKYIEKLEGEIEVFEARNDRTQNRLRKANWAKWSR
ncbi:hypothetical protein [Silvibacterium dinghuense]|uniref:Uncharacterized protein n=1 Tax=Silvibacterium dinghuense TaxID=1560006 RepID=A0A4V1NUQ8_9BACT|nr:hypothetical protein [Silvibacterium dinghuense]RXS93072.1 hypothetical protein ESZ00_19810 [Silvibacterium dinghuense]GGG89631.1 hypothetical protein GCM10011586_00020 [Silvibacterium dinghuense]